MAESLRDRQRQLTRSVILDAAADEIAESGLEDVSLQAVADRAGVSKRTLYNYFPSREELLAGVLRHFDERTVELGGRVTPLPDLDEFPPTVLANYRVWTELGSVFRAGMAIGNAARLDQPNPPDRQRRRVALEQGVRTAADGAGADLSDEEIRLISHLVSAIGSSTMYERLVTQDGLSTDEAGAAVAWLADLIKESVMSGRRIDLKGAQP